jgi:hypothetical protein
LDQQEDHQEAKRRYNLQNDQWSELTKPDEEKDNGGRLGLRGMGGKKSGKRSGKSSGPGGKSRSKSGGINLGTD